MRKFYYGAICGIGGFGYGQGIVVMWPEWSAWTWWGLTTAIVVPALIAPLLWDRRAKLVAIVGRAHSDILPTAFAAFVIAAAVSGAGAGLYFLVGFIPERPSTVWVHPTLAPDEQERVKAECEMEALREVGPGDLDPELSGRAQYTDACLRAQDFSKERVEEGGGE